MASSESDDVPVLQDLSARNRPSDSYAYEPNSPLYANINQEFVFQPPQSPSTTSNIYNEKNMFHRAKGWAKRLWSFLLHGVVNPDAKSVQRWNKLLIISCLFALLLDPFFFFVLYVQENNKCIVLNWPMATTLIVLRSINDFIYLLHILLKFRLAYVASGELIEDSKMIARNYLSGPFIIDLFVVLPLSQIIIILVSRDPIGFGTNPAKLLVRLTVLVQLVPRLHRLLTLVVGSSPTSFIFESAWSNVVMNLLTFVLASHVVGSCWYLFALQRVSQCFQDACRDSNITRCMDFINCRHGNGNKGAWEAWTNNENAIACFGKDGSFNFGIYETAVNLTTEKSIVTRYAYSMFWGFQQISTLAGNQVPSYFVWEVVFTTVITGVGLLLFALLIGNVQNFLQALGRRRVEMYVRRRDVEQWMIHCHLPEELRSKVRNCERFNNSAVASVVVNEKDMMEYLPKDLQQQIRFHRFKFVKRMRIFQLMDEPIIDAIWDRLKTETYSQGSKIFYHNGLIDKMVFIISGKMVCIGEDKISYPLTEGDVCGEELTWTLEHASVNKDGKRIRNPGDRLLSNRVVSCETNVEAFVLRAADLEEVASLFARFFRSPRVQGAIRYESTYWRVLAVKRIQVAWRLKKKRINQADSSSPKSS